MTASYRWSGRPSRRRASASGRRSWPPAEPDTRRIPGSSVTPRRCSVAALISSQMPSGDRRRLPAPGDDPGGSGHGRVTVPRDDLVAGPEVRVGLLAAGAGQPAEGVDAPADADRAGAHVTFAERGRIGMPGDAGAHLAPHDRHPELITDQGPHRGPGVTLGWPVVGLRWLVVRLGRLVVRLGRPVVRLRWPVGKLRRPVVRLRRPVVRLGGGLGPG